jgi:hypothetical protein
MGETTPLCTGSVIEARDASGESLVVRRPQEKKETLLILFFLCKHIGIAALYTPSTNMAVVDSPTTAPAPLVTETTILLSPLGRVTAISLVCLRPRLAGLPDGGPE